MDLYSYLMYVALIGLMVVESKVIIFNFNICGVREF